MPRAGRLSHLIEMLFGGDHGIGQRRNLLHAWHSLDQDLLPLAVELGCEQADTGDVAARLGERGRKAFADEVLAHAVQRNGSRRGA